VTRPAPNRHDNTEVYNSIFIQVLHKYNHIATRYVIHTDNKFSILSLHFITETRGDIPMSNTNPFTQTTYDLGVGDEYGYDLAGVNDIIIRTAYETGLKCCVCTNTPAYRVVPKKAKHNTAEMQNGVYICQHCVSTKAIDTRLYALKSLT
jgi:hypothetical protein